MKDSIITARLELRPMSVESMTALFEGRFDDFAQFERIKLPEGRWDFLEPVHSWLPPRIKRVAAVPGIALWSNRIVVRCEDAMLVANAGFHEPPGMHPRDNEFPGIVEFGYGVAPPFRRMGYAYEASVGLIEWARNEHGVERFQLSTAPSNLASKSLIEKLGFEPDPRYPYRFIRQFED
jgi:ribosomal-protein-alanine N-acetyltransferase